MDVLRFLAASLTKNWGLKLVALLLAIVLFHSIKSDIGRNQGTNDRTFFKPATP